MLLLYTVLCHTDLHEADVLKRTSREIQGPVQSVTACVVSDFGKYDGVLYESELLMNIICHEVSWTMCVVWKICVGKTKIESVYSI